MASFAKKRVTQSDYRGGVTRNTKDKIDVLDTKLAKLSFKSDRSKSVFKNKINESIQIIYDVLLPENFKNKDASIDKIETHIYKGLGLE